MNSSANHIWHCWMNRLNEGKKADGWDHSIYLWKDALAFAEYGHDRIKQAFDGTLPQTHQQCSFSAPERIEQNTLRCCLGQEADRTGRPVRGGDRGRVERGIPDG